MMGSAAQKLFGEYTDEQARIDWLALLAENDALSVPPRGLLRLVDDEPAHGSDARIGFANGKYRPQRRDAGRPRVRVEWSVDDIDALAAVLSVLHAWEQE